MSILAFSANRRFDSIPFNAAARSNRRTIARSVNASESSCGKLAFRDRRKRFVGQGKFLQLVCLKANRGGEFGAGT